MFAAAFLEALYLIGLYFPGSVIKVAALLAAPTIWHMALVVAAIWAGTVSGLIIDWLAGRRFPKVPGDGDSWAGLQRRTSWSSILFAVHPNVSVTYVFDRSARHLLTLKDFANLCAAALVFLVASSAILAGVGSVGGGEQRHAALVWAIIVILFGIEGLVSAIQRRRSAV